MSLKIQQRLRILEENPHAIDALMRRQGDTSYILIIMDSNHPKAKLTVPRTYFGYPVHVRFAEPFNDDAI